MESIDNCWGIRISDQASCLEEILLPSKLPGGDPPTIQVAWKRLLHEPGCLEKTLLPANPPQNPADISRVAAFISYFPCWCRHSIIQLPLSHLCSWKEPLTYTPVRNTSKLIGFLSQTLVDSFLCSVITALSGMSRCRFESFQPYM